jgi:hypothetical protein
MICRYEFTLRATCPVDGTLDVYDVAVESPDAVHVEHILASAAALVAKPVLQEDLTAALARTLGCRVVTSGHHSGVKTTVGCP